MTAICMPEIAKDEYEAFRVIMTDHIPVTYDEWLALAKRLRNDVIKSGKDVTPVEVKAGEFAKFIGMTAASPDPISLCKFAREKISQHV